jgi:AbrB family looped-hinge helix DNA binding protein
MIPTVKSGRYCRGEHPALSIVTVKNKYQVVIPQPVREQIDVAVGDILEARVERGKITLTPKSVVDRATAEGLEDVRRGRVRGPFKTVDEMIDSLKGRKRRVHAKAS